MRDAIWANFGLLAAGVATFVMMGAAQALYGPALPAFARDLGLTATAAGWLVSANWIGCALGVALMYLAGARVAPRHPLALMGLGAVLLALGPGRVGTFAGAVIFGAGYGMSTVVFNPRILRVFGAHGTSMLSLLNACFGVGAILAPLAFVWMGSNPMTAFLGVAILAGLIWLGAGPAGRAGAAPVASEAGRFRPMLPLHLFAVAGIGMEASLIGLGPTALIDMGVAETRAAELLSLFFVAFLGSRLALVFTAHLAAPFTLYLGAMVVAAMAALAAAWVAPEVFFVVMGLSAGLFFPSYYVAASRVMGDDPRTPPTIIAAGLVGGILAPILLGMVMDPLGGRGFFLLLAGLAGGAALAAILVRGVLPELRGTGNLAP